MDQDTFLFTIPQWIVFAGIISIAYGWVEKKKIFIQIGTGFFIILGGFAVYAIAGGYFIFNEYLTPNEIISEELEENVIEELPRQAKLLPAYWLFVVSGILAVPTLYLEIKKKRISRWMVIGLGLIVLAGFFIIVGALK